VFRPGCGRGLMSLPLWCVRGDVGCRVWMVKRGIADCGFGIALSNAHLTGSMLMCARMRVI